MGTPAPTVGAVMVHAGHLRAKVAAMIDAGHSPAGLMPGAHDDDDDQADDNGR